MIRLKNNRRGGSGCSPSFLDRWENAVELPIDLRGGLDPLFAMSGGGKSDADCPRNSRASVGVESTKQDPHSPRGAA